MKRRVKAWVIADHRTLYSLMFRKGDADEDARLQRVAGDYNAQAIPCTITYEVPKKKRRGR
jgi:hypothetical protein